MNIIHAKRVSRCCPFSNIFYIHFYASLYLPNDTVFTVTSCSLACSHRISRTQCASSHSSFSYTIQRNGRAHDRRNTTSQGTLAHPFQPLLTFCVCSPVVVSFGYSIYTKKIHPALIGLKPSTMIPCRGEAVTWSFISSVIIWANLFMSAGNYSDNATSVNNG